MNYFDKISGPKSAAILSILVLTGILIIGLNPKGFYFTNNFEWLKDRPGIRFKEYALAHTGPVGRAFSGQNGLSIQIALKPASYDAREFNSILMLHNGEDAEQLLIGQWRSWIILMNGDDYAHKKKTKRLSFDSSSQPSAARFLTIATGRDGTRLYVDGRPAGARKDFRLKIPLGENTRLVLGNSVYGRHSWGGDIYGLAFYGRTLSSEEAAHSFDRWRRERGFGFAAKQKPLLLYVFDEKSGHRALDRSGGELHLEIPPALQLVQKEILRLPWKDLRLDRNFFSDFTLNYLGFIPLGLVLGALFVNFRGFFETHAVPAAAASCFAVSLTMEIVQAWMPPRSSQMLDLILNTLGGLTGAMIFAGFVRRRGKITK